MSILELMDFFFAAGIEYCTGVLRKTCGAFLPGIPLLSSNCDATWCNWSIVAGMNMICTPNFMCILKKLSSNRLQALIWELGVRFYILQLLEDQLWNI